MPFLPNKNPVLPGCLYLVSTPIGNLGDITLRALATLQDVDLVAAEDTRNTARLLKHFGIEKPLLSLHEHNELHRSRMICGLLEEGKSLALVSDAGTPTLSDPGFVLVREILAKNLPVIPIPGVSAALTLMSVAGLPTDRFLFCGFPPKKAGRRTKWLEDLAAFPFPTIFYVSPHAITALIEELIAIFGDRPAALGREMTKIHEEFLRGNLSEIGAFLAERDRMRGEFSLIVGGKEAEGSEGKGSEASENLDLQIERALLEGNAKVSKLAKDLSKRLHLDREKVYERILSLKNSGKNF